MKIQPAASFKETLALLPAVDGIARIELKDAAGTCVASIENQPGKQGSLVVYRYLEQAFGALNAEAAAHGLEIFGEHTPDARNRPGAHPNIDRLFAIVEGGDTLRIEVISA